MEIKVVMTPAQAKKTGEYVQAIADSMKPSMHRGDGKMRADYVVKSLENMARQLSEAGADEGPDECVYEFTVRSC